jgi:hypothetical protein
MGTIEFDEEEERINIIFDKQIEVNESEFFEIKLEVYFFAGR